MQDMQGALKPQASSVGVIGVDASNTIESVRTVTEMVESGYDTSMLIGLSISAVASFLRNGVGAYIFLPAAAAIGIFKTGLSLADLIRSKNKNIGKVGGFLLDLLTNSILTTAIVGGALTIAALIGILPLLFAVGMTISLVYNTSKAIYCGYRWAVAKDEESKASYRQRCRQHGITAAVSLILFVVVGLMTFLKVPTLAVSITCAIFGAIDFGVKIVEYIRERKSQKQEQAAASALVAKSPPVADQSLRVAESHQPQSAQTITTLLTKNLTVPITPATAKTSTPTPTVTPPVISTPEYKPSLFDYYYGKNRVNKLAQVGNHEHQRLYLITEIQQKLADLLALISAKTFSGFFQNSKRQAKFQLLRRVLVLLLTDEELQQIETTSPQYRGQPMINQQLKAQLQRRKVDTLAQMLECKSYKHYFSRAYQSFFKHIGDTEDLMDAVSVYFDKSFRAHHTSHSSAPATSLLLI